MTLQVSTGFKQLILGPLAFEDIFNGGAIQVFSNVQPESADAAVNGTLLGTITLDGKPWTPDLLNGLRFFRDGPFISAMPGDRWVLTPSVSGNSGWWRLIANPGDAGQLSYTAPRIDGAVGVPEGGAEMALPDTALVVGVARVIGSFFYTIPPIVGA